MMGYLYLVYLISIKIYVFFKIQVIFFYIISHFLTNIIDGVTDIQLGQALHVYEARSVTKDMYSVVQEEN